MSSIAPIKAGGSRSDDVSPKRTQAGQVDEEIGGLWTRVHEPRLALRPHIAQALDAFIGQPAALAATSAEKQAGHSEQQDERDVKRCVEAGTS
jgi:hypothetical protein